MRKLRVWIAVIVACVSLAACGWSQTQNAAEFATEESGGSTDTELLTEDSESTGSEPEAENSESADLGTQAENGESVDSGTQTENSESVDSGAQTENSESVDSGVQTENSESVDSGTQTDNIESADSGTPRESSEPADSDTPGNDSGSTDFDFPTEDSDSADSEPSADDSIEQNEETDMITITVGDTVLTAKLENNESAKAFRDLMPITVQMSGYGGFEQVGSLGTRLPRKDRQTTTSAGDIMLYNGNSVVMFYGSNSWSYTRLGKIEGKSASELRDILGDGDIEVTFAAEN